MSKKEELKKIIDKKRIMPVFQPIVSLKDGTVYGYEALSRIVGKTTIQNTEELFCLAAVYGKTWDLERLCRKKIIRKYAKLLQDSESKKLFINVNPAVMMDEAFRGNFTREHLMRYGICPEKVVIEITERNSIHDMDAFLKVVHHYKEEGYQIAIDDVGSCYSGLNVVCDTRPHFMKIDMCLIREIHKNPMKYALVKGLSEMAKNSSMKLVAEGIETVDELNVLLKLGIEYGQGYLLGKPDENLLNVKQTVKALFTNHIGEMPLLRWDGVEYKMLEVSLGDYSSLDVFAANYGDELADSMTGLFFDSVKNALRENELMKIIGDIRCIVFVEKERWKEAMEEMTVWFLKESACLYTHEDYTRGYMEKITQKGKRKELPLISMMVERYE